MKRICATVAFVAVALLALILVVSCGAGKHSKSAGTGFSAPDANPPAQNPYSSAQGSNASAPASKSLDAALSEIRGYTPPAKVDPEVFDKLRSALTDKLKELDAQRKDGTAGRIVSSAPQGDAGKVTDLAYDAGTNMLSWSYVNLGDYDVNGEVGVSDITPIALHFGALTNDGVGDDALEAWIDGDKTGEVGVSDITPVAMHYLNDVREYRIMTSDFPDSEFISTGNPIPRGSSTLFPKSYNAPVLPSSLKYIAVIPYADDFSAGQMSNAIQHVATGLSAVTPTEGFPGAYVTFSPVFLDEPYPITYTWDFGGGALPNLSSERTPSVYLSDPGTYIASVSYQSSSDSGTFPFSLTINNPYSGAVSDSLFLLPDKTTYTVGDIIRLYVYIYSNSQALANVNTIRINVPKSMADAIQTHEGAYFSDFDGSCILQPASLQQPGFLDTGVVWGGGTTEVTGRIGLALSIDFQATLPGTCPFELILTDGTNDRTYFSDLSSTRHYWSTLGKDYGHGVLPYVTVQIEP